MAIKKSKKNLKIIGATSMALFSLVSVFVATIAWFALNNSVGASGMAIKAHASGPAFSSITVHRCILSECNTDQYVFSTTPEVTGTTSGAGSGASGLSGEYSVAMDQYTDLGPSQPILLLFTLPDETMVDNNILLDGICTYTGSSANYIASLSSMDTSNTQKLSSIVSFYGRASADSSTYFTYSDSSGKIVFSRNSTYLNTSSFVTKDTIDDVDNYTFNKENHHYKYIIISHFII